VDKVQAKQRPLSIALRPLHWSKGSRKYRARVYVCLENDSWGKIGIE